jgi:hypothetical protein
LTLTTKGPGNYQLPIIYFSSLRARRGNPGRMGCHGLRPSRDKNFRVISISLTPLQTGTNHERL